jgi:exopolysaccharide biosynthesis operon protein EpsL
MRRLENTLEAATFRLMTTGLSRSSGQEPHIPVHYFSNTAKTTMPISHAHRFCAVLALCSAPLVGFSQPVTMPTQVSDVISVDVGGGFEYHDNIFRVRNGPSDTVLRGLLGLRFERELSLQRLSAFATLEPVKYLDFSRYDYLGYNLGAAWDWEVGRPVFGRLETRLLQTQSSFDTLGAGVNNLMKDLFFRGLVGFRLTQSWSMIGAADYLSSENSALSQQAANFDRTGIEAGVRYASGAALDVDFVYRREDGDYPNRQVFDVNGNLLPAAVDNAYSQDALLMRIGYRPSDVSRIGGTIGYTRRGYDNISQRDFDGITGSLDVEWPLSGQVTMRASVFRAIDTSELLTSNYIDVLGFALTPVWRMTSRVTLDGLLNYSQRDFQGDPGFIFTGAEVRKDKLLDFGIRVNYEFARRVFFFADLRRLDRSSNYSEFDFVDNWFGLGVRASF